MDECIYCKKTHGAFLTAGLFEQSRIECLIDVSSNKCRWTLCVNNGAFAPIQYCPKCGRKLED